MNETIARAIRDRRRLAFVYHGVVRKVEPQCYGLGHRGTELLRARQVLGEGPPERLFNVAEIERLQLLDECFDRPGPHYRRGDSAMRTIFCQLEDLG